jgi:hypothetical protein
MAVSEAARSDLYRGLVEVLGPERAETLMSLVPPNLDELATKHDLQVLESNLKSEIRTVLSVEIRAEREQFDNRLTSELGSIREQFDSRLTSELASFRKHVGSEFGSMRGELASGFAALNARIDRLFYAMIVVLLGIVAAMTALVIRL